MINLDLEKKDRRTAVWTVCDHLATVDNVKPTVREVRRYYSYGSTTDVQNDINAWWDVMLAFYRDRYTRPGLPASVVEGMEAIWTLALEEAGKTTEAAKLEAQQQIAAAMEEMTASRAAAEAAREETRGTAVKLDLANQNVEHLQAQVTDLEGRLAQETAQRGAAESQIAMLREEIARKDAEFRAAVEAHGAQLKAEQEAHAIQLKAEQDRYDGMNRHLMQQTDDIRRQKAEESKSAQTTITDLRTMAEAYRKRASAAEDASAVSKGRLEQQTEELAALRAENASIANRLSEQIARGSADLATTSAVLTAHQRILQIAVSKLRAIKETPAAKVAEAVNSAVESVEVALSSNGVKV